MLRSVSLSQAQRDNSTVYAPTPFTSQVNPLFLLHCGQIQPHETSAVGQILGRCKL